MPSINQPVAAKRWRLTPKGRHRAAQAALQPNLQAALLYADLGYPVLPVWPLQGTTCTCRDGVDCKTPGKHPINKAWPKMASTNEVRVRAMFRKHPDAHVGMMPREDDVILDIDPRNGGDARLKQLLANASIPATPTQLSGGGGTHYILRGEINGQLGKGIDIKRPGKGFVVAWPSGHASGGEYKWRDGLAPWDVEPAPVPKQLQGIEREVETEPRPLPSVSPAEMRKMLACIPADDREQWVNIGQALRHSYGDEVGRELWSEWSQTSDKWNESEDPEKWESFDKNRDRPLFTIRSIRQLAKKNGYRDPITASSPSEFAPTLLSLGDLAGMTSTEPAPLQWAMKPCVPLAKVTLLAGAGGSSKSFLALTMAMQFAIGEPFGRFEPGTTGKALMLVAEEDEQDVHRRVRAIVKARQYTAERCAMIERNLFVVSVRGQDWRLLYMDEDGNLRESDRVQYLINEIRNHNVKLVGLDPLVFFNGGDENDNADMSRLMAVLDRIASETGAAVLVLHHVSKGGQVTSLNDATQAVVRGASALVDNARSAILLTRLPRKDAAMYGLKDEDADRHIVARHLKSNYGPHMPDSFFAVEAGGALRYAPEVEKVHATPAQATKVAEAESTELLVLTAYDKNPEASQREVATQIRRDQSTVKRAADRLATDGLLKKEIFKAGGNAAFVITKKGKKKLANAMPKGDITDLF